MLSPCLKKWAIPEYNVRHNTFFAKLATRTNILLCDENNFDLNFTVVCS